MVMLKLHHLGDYMQHDGTLKVTRQHLHSRTAATFTKWLETYRAPLMAYLNETVPKWQAAPKTWEVAPPAEVRTETVVGARLAKQEKTRRVVHEGKRYDVEIGYYDRQMEQDSFDLTPVCEQHHVIPLDIRVVKLLVFLFEVETMFDPPPYAIFDAGVEQGPEDKAWLLEEGPAALVWDQGLNPSYWDDVPPSRRTLVTISQQVTDQEPWFVIPAAAAPSNKYPVQCKWHKCLKAMAVRPTAVYLHTPLPIQPEALDAMEEFLRELFGDTTPARVRRPAVPLLPRTYLKPNRTPGVHFHNLPRLATVAGVVAATDAGAPSVRERKAARGVDELPDEGPGMTAAGISKDAQGGYTTASIRAPATSQEGEALSLLYHIVSVSRIDGVVWVIVDSEAAAQSLRAYLQGRRTGGSMKDLYAQHLDKLIMAEDSQAAINVVVTPSHRVTSVNRLADEATKMPSKTRGDWILRRHLAFDLPRR